MIKKILFVLCLTISSLAFSQQKTVSELSAAPNPFTISTDISYTSKTSQKITLIVKNVLGKLLYKKKYDATIGVNTVTFLKNDLKSGIYFYQIQSSKNLISKRFVIK